MPLLYLINIKSHGHQNRELMIFTVHPLRCLVFKDPIFKRQLNVPEDFFFRPDIDNLFHIFYPIFFK